MLDSDLYVAGIPKTTEDGKLDFHCFRVSYICWLIEAGTNPKVTQTLARHKSPEMTFNIYAKVKKQSLQDNAEALFRSLDS